tara:strand:- start:710 stop:2035 length:1326 start_codon:yes stop_codon:yes gene_type:complete
MAKNVYFSGGTTSEQRLYEDLIIESLKIYGHDVYYLPREIVKEDDLFTEDVLSKFDENYMIEMYISNYEGFEGDGSLLTKFGVRIADEATFIISKRRWEDLISSSNNLVSNFRPNEGDAIYLPLTDQIFQIKFVEHEKPFRQLDGIQTYNLVAELMEYSGERLETGVEEIDKITREIGYTQVLKLTDGIKDFVITNGGSGYGSGTAVTIGGPGTGASATVTTTNGAVTSVNVVEPGVGFATAPVIGVTGSGAGAAVTALIASNGNFEFGEKVKSTANTAKAVAVKTFDQISAINLYDNGAKYTTAPTVTITGGGGSGATAVATINTTGQVSGITLTATGSNYTSTPTVTIQASPNETTAKVVRFDKTNKELELTDIVGTFTDNDTIVGLTSGAEWTINTFSSIENENDPEAENDFFESEGDDIIDWTENNPFGEYGNQGVF